MEKYLAVVEYISERLSEPSTWATLTALLAAAGVSLPVGIAQNCAVLAAGIAGLLGVIMKEQGSSEKKDVKSE